MRPHRGNCNENLKYRNGSEPSARSLCYISVIRVMRALLLRKANLRVSITETCEIAAISVLKKLLLLF